MSDQSEATIVLELADAVEELTRHHIELLRCVRSFQNERHQPPTAVSYQPPAPRLVLPPPAPEATTPAAQPTPVSVGTESLGAPSAGLSGADASGSPHPLTKRHYDYFAELDDLLARLPVTPDPNGPRPTPDH